MSVDKIENSTSTWIIRRSEPQNSLEHGYYRMFNANDNDGDGFLSVEEAKPTKNTDWSHASLLVSPHEALKSQQNQEEKSSEEIKVMAQKLAKMMIGKEDPKQKIPPEQLLPSLSQLGKAHQSIKEMIEVMQIDKDLSVTA